MKYTVKLSVCNGLSSVLKIINIRLVGEKGVSDWTWSSGLRSLLSFGESTIPLTCSKPLGKLLCVNLQKEQILAPVDQWFIEKVEVTTSNGEVFKFPIYHWTKRKKVYSFNEGKALKASESEKNLSTKQIREEELKRRAQKYCWKEYKTGLPHCMKADDVSRLPSEVQFSFKKSVDFNLTAVREALGMFLRNLWSNTEPWKDFKAIEEKTKNISNDVTKYVQQHWEEESFFGYVFLNGVNPTKIRRIKDLPKNFPVTDAMVKMTLSDEMKTENIFLCDFEHLAQVETSKINNEEQYLTAPLVLLRKTSVGELKPIAIQLKQTGVDNPIFLPTDSKYDWALAKTFVSSASFNEHQLNAHLLSTHLMAEVFSVSLLRNTTKVHPIYKLLIPHTRYTLQINLLARQKLISKKGAFTTNSATSEQGITTILQRSMKDLTYSSLCIKDDIKERGLESMPNYYYRDDGFRLWDIIEKFVRGVVTYYYNTNEEIQGDPDLQNYIKDIFEHGFLSKKETGIPQTFSTVDELVKFATMVIFTGSAQHAAVNNGQFDFASWMPNIPSSLQRPPPTTKGKATEQTLLETLPDPNTTANAVSVLRLLTTQSTDFVPLGHFPNEHFTEDVPKKLMAKFRLDLEKLEKEINDRNKGLPLPYTYLKPSLIENSVSI